MPATKTIRVWDLPTRLFHWSLVTLVALAWYFVKQGDIANHALCGQWILVLILFRLVWGVMGSTTARFSHFVRNPMAAIAYLRSVLNGQKIQEIGHNPAGAFMILALLFAFGLQAAVGLFTKEDDFAYFNGPLLHWITPEQSTLLTQYHREAAWILLLLVTVHVLVNLIYLFGLKENLIRPMITGTKMIDADSDLKPPHLGNPWVGLVLFLMLSGMVWGGLKMAAPPAAAITPATQQDVPRELEDWE